MNASTCEVAVVTRDPEFYYEIIKHLKKMRVKYLVLDPNQPIPSNIKIILTTRKEKRKIKFPKVISGKVEEVIDQYKKICRKEFNEIIVGIDPGSKPGIAVLGDGRLLELKRLSSPENIVEYLRELFSKMYAEKKRIKVGRGGGTYKLRIINTLRREFNIDIEEVDESGTTPQAKKKREKDIIAAMFIAVKKGKIIEEKIEITPTKGEIKEIQKKSRIISKNFTISKKLAEKVAKGEIRLEEAIELVKKKKDKNELSSSK
ncbi:MAG: hypothetical protein DRN25_00320 [Thermoplasmata archaeon]|nr:MAG: hypothetical protein DRN25_00320 [Thermoplasmata archaeon]